MSPGPAKPKRIHPTKAEFVAIEAACCILPERDPQLHPYIDFANTRSLRSDVRAHLAAYFAGDPP